MSPRVGGLAAAGICISVCRGASPRVKAADSEERCIAVEQGGAVLSV